MGDFVPVAGFPLYKVSKRGIVLGQNGKRLADRTVGSSRPGNIPYLIVALYDGHGKRTEKFVHHVVLETFVGPRPEGMEARHLNGNHSDNRLRNLAWGTRAQNGQDKIEHSPNCKKCGRPLEGRNLMMVKNGRPNRARKCRACHNERTLAYNNARNAERRKEVAGR